MRASLQPFATIAPFLLAACMSTFDPDDDDLVVGSQTWPTPYVVQGQGAVRVLMRQGQVGEHRDGVHRAWRVETENGSPLCSWLTTTPLVDFNDGPLVRVSGGGTVFAFEPGEAIDSRDRQHHQPKGWYRVGAGRIRGDRFDDLALLADGGVWTLVTAGNQQLVRSHGPDDRLRGECTIVAGSLRWLDGANGIAEPADGGGQVLVDAALTVRGRIVDQASAPGEFVDLARLTNGASSLFGLDATRALVTPQGVALTGPWQQAWAVAGPGCVVVLLLEPDDGLTIVDPSPNSCRVLLRDATFALVQSRNVPAEYADVRLGTSLVVVLAGQADESQAYALFAAIGNHLHGPFAAASSEAATVAMWAGLSPVVEVRRAELAQQQALAAAAAERGRAAVQQAIDAAKATLAEVSRHQDAYFHAIQTGDAAAADRAIAAIDARIAGFLVPIGHAATDALRRELSLASAYRLDWELRRADRCLERIAHWGAGYQAQGGALYARYAREVGRLVALHDGVPRPTFDALMRTSPGFDAATRSQLDRLRGGLEQFENGERYRAHLAAGRFQQAHDMAYQLGFEGWVEHLLGPAKDRLPEHELEALLRIAVDRAATPELRARLQAAHHDQWRTMVAAQRREQNERFRRQDEEHRRAEAGRAMAERAARAAYRDEALRRGFVWREN